MTSEGPDLDMIKRKVVAGRDAIQEARLALNDHELDEKLAEIKQHLYDAEDYADLALHLIDPKLVS